LNRHQEYNAASRQFLNKAYEELAQGDVVQASEKGWGAAAQMVKDIAEQRDWTHTSHPALRQIVSRLVEETGDDRLSTLFRVADSLHINFYENWDTPIMVELGLKDVQQLLDKLEPLLE
jgi:hypothetical protein